MNKVGMVLDLVISLLLLVLFLIILSALKGGG